MLSKKNKNQAFTYEEEFNQSNDSLEKNKSPKFIIGNEELLLDQEKSKLLLNLIKNVYPAETQNKVYILPKWIDLENFEIFMEILTNSQQNNLSSKFSNYYMDFSILKKVVEISIFFKAFSITKIIVEEHITTNLDKTSCLKVLIDYMEYIYNEEIRLIFLSLIHICIGIASNNIFYLVNNKHEELFAIAEDSLEEIFERYFESVIFNNSKDHSLLIRLMIEYRKLNDVYELLENERKRAINIFDKVYQEGLDPTIIWNIKSNDPASGFYKESEEFEFEKISIIMINYYDAAKDIYNMAIKITDIKDVKNTTNSETDSQININPQNSNQNQFIISILSICEIPEIKFKSKINFNCIFSNTKSKVLVFKIENFSKNFEVFEEIDFSMKIYFMISYNFSSILTHICKNFYEYYSLNSISKISRNVLNIILRNEILNVQNEDEVLHAVMNWINNKQNANIENVEELIKNIKWYQVSLDGLLDFIINESKILMLSTVLQNMLISEFSRRFKEEYAKEMGTSPDTKLLTNGSNQMWNANNPTNNSNMNNNKSNSFTSELIFKLIKIASRYESTNKNTVSLNNSSINNQSQHSNLQSRKILSNNKLSNNNSTIKNFNFQEDSKISLIGNAVNTSPSTSVNKNRNSSMHELENSKSRDISKSKDFSRNKDYPNYNLSKSNNSPYKKDKFIRNMKSNNNSKSDSISFNNNDANRKSLNLINDVKNKRNIFQNNFLKNSKGNGENSSNKNNKQIELKENYRSDSDFNNANENEDRTNTPNTRGLNRDFSENVVYSNKVKPKNNLNYTNRDSQTAYANANANLLSDKDRRNPKNNSNTSSNKNLINPLSQNSTSSNLHKNNNNLEKKKTGHFNYNFKNSNQFNASSNTLNNSTKNNNNINQSSVDSTTLYQFKNNNNNTHKNLNANVLSSNSITLNNNYNSIIMNNNNKSLNMNSKYISSDKKMSSQTIDSNNNNLNKNGLISYMKPKACEILKNKQTDNSNSNSNIAKNKYFKKDTRPKSVNEKKLLKK